MTSNGKSLEPVKNLIRDKCGVDIRDKRYHIVGCEDFPHFGQTLANGDKVNTEKAHPGMIAKKVVEALKKYPRSRAFLLEYAELPFGCHSISHRFTSL